MIKLLTVFGAYLVQYCRSIFYGTTKGIGVNWKNLKQSVWKMATKGGKCLTGYLMLMLSLKLFCS